MLQMTGGLFIGRELAILVRRICWRDLNEKPAAPPTGLSTNAPQSKLGR